MNEKRYIRFWLAVILASAIISLLSCEKDNDNAFVEVIVSASGYGRFEAGWNVGYFQDNGYKTWVNDFWSDTILCAVGDTVYMASCANDNPVTLCIDDYCIFIGANRCGWLQKIIK